MGGQQDETGRPERGCLWRPGEGAGAWASLVAGKLSQLGALRLVQLAAWIEFGKWGRDWTSRRTSRACFGPGTCVDPLACHTRTPSRGPSAGLEYSVEGSLQGRLQQTGLRRAPQPGLRCPHSDLTCLTPPRGVRVIQSLCLFPR